MYIHSPIDIKCAPTYLITMSCNVHAYATVIVTTITMAMYFQTNTFQCILATNGTQSYVLFFYADGEMQWTTGDASGGTAGLGGTPAQVGFNAGNGVNYYSCQC